MLVKLKAVNPAEKESIPDSIAVNEDDSILSLKEKIQAASGISFEEQKLIYKGKVLVNLKSIKDYSKYM